MGVLPYTDVMAEDTILKEIETYCDRVGLKPSTVSRLALNDGKFFNRIMGGGRYRPETGEKMRKYLKNYPFNE